jgi:hypothetical protein
MYVTLSDFSTYDTNAFFVILNEAGIAELDSAGDMKNVDENNFEAIISFNDLISAYNQVHSTSY